MCRAYFWRGGRDRRKTIPVKSFIENGRFHGKQIAAALTGGAEPFPILPYRSASRVRNPRRTPIGIGGPRRVQRYPPRTPLRVPDFNRPDARRFAQDLTCGFPHRRFLATQLQFDGTTDTFRPCPSSSCNQREPPKTASPRQSRVYGLGEVQQHHIRTPPALVRGRLHGHLARCRSPRMWESREAK